VTSGAPPERHPPDELAAERNVPALLDTTAELLDDLESDPRETALMRRLGFDSLLMLRMECDAKPWGLVEVYDNRRGGFSVDDVATASTIVESANHELSRLSSR
jgi:hypothetical protein